MDKNVNNVQENVNEAMDSRIVKINAILSTKLSAVSKGKREGLKAQKSSCKFLLENWDNEKHLLHFVEDSDVKEKQYELWCIGKSRIDQLQFKKRQEERKKIDLKELSEFKGNPADLSKDANQCWAILHGYYDTDNVMQEELKEDELFASAMEYRKKMIADAVKGLKVKKSVKATSEHKEAASKQQKQAKHNVGDIHPNGKWVWVEYKPGKFDWRTIGSRAHQEAIKNGLKPSGVMPDKSSAVRTKGKKEKTTKSKKQEPKKQEVKRMTMEELNNAVKALPKNGMSDAQRNIVKYIKKGYRITADRNFMENADDRKSIVWGAFEALMKRIKVTEENLPMGLFK